MNQPLYTLRGLLTVTATVAGIFGIARWLELDTGATLVLAILYGPIPLSLVLERIFGSAPKTDRPQHLGLAIRSYVALVPPALLTAAAAFIGMAGIPGVAGIPPLGPPMPLLTFVPLLFGAPMPIALALPIVSFWVFTLYLCRSSSPQAIPLRFPILLTTATVYSVLWFAFLLSPGVQYHGIDHTVAVATINGVCITMLWSLWFSFRHRTSKAAVLVFATLLFSWLFGFALPYLGEVAF